MHKVLDIDWTERENKSLKSSVPLTPKTGAWIRGTHMALSPLWMDWTGHCTWGIPTLPRKTYKTLPETLPKTYLL